MRTIKGTTKKGQDLLWRATRNEGYSLSDVYDKASPKKQAAYDACFAMYAEDPTAIAFRIISHNTFSFSVAWECEQGTRIETRDNSYLVTNELI